MIMSQASEIIISREFDLFLDEVCVNEIEIVNELVADIHKDGQLLVNDVLSNFESKDFRSMLRAAHSLKSATKIFGAGIISYQAGVIEEMLHANDNVNLAELAGNIVSIQENFDSFLAGLDKKVSEI